LFGSTTGLRFGAFFSLRNGISRGGAFDGEEGPVEAGGPEAVQAVRTASAMRRKRFGDITSPA
jgi:hypothetical protein